MPLTSFFVSSPDTHSERRLDSDLTVAQLKDKLVPITGIAQQWQVLSLHASDDGPAIAQLVDDGATLASYGLREFYVVKVANTDPNARPGEYTDVSAVDKFELTPAEYEARNDTVLSHLKANKLGRFADVPENLTHAPPAAVPSTLKVGARVEISPDGGLTKRGTVRFVGLADIGKGGVWVGVELDEPTGKGDGAVDGHRYFSAAPKHAAFVRPDKVTVGDFPEEDLLASDDEI
ncbi:Tubulin-folding cofactor B [Vanrija pseudolonga]|uniref:Tubulin-folding cofactor B n=1 Tax=Vanrija pseudolonga TaxID=143232 RepID=A0AAF0YIX8_9TREE|nr:Tubulin-folding cofactor B [Vanrija pseudolonga]